jgi:hypothetical protein
MTAASLPGPLIGWPLLPVPDEGGQLNWPSLEDSIRQSIQVILLTRPGELLMHPEWGAGLQDFVHEENTLVTRRRMHERIVEALERWEPRIELERVAVAEDDEDSTLLQIEIAYRVRRTGAPHTARARVQMGR